MREDIAPIFTKDFVDVKIDVDEMEFGQDLMNEYQGGPKGLPWLAILRPDGTVITTSDDPEQGNIGSPIAEWEIAHWNVMMRASVKRITEEEIEYMARTLAEDRGDP